MTTDKQNRWRCVVSIQDNVLHNKTYWCFKEICDELNLTYQQVSDIRINRKNKFRDNKFKFAPEIKIEKLIET